VKVQSSLQRCCFFRRAAQVVVDRTGRQGFLQMATQGGQAIQTAQIVAACSGIRNWDADALSAIFQMVN